jgi:amino acid transporter
MSQSTEPPAAVTQLPTAAGAARLANDEVGLGGSLVFALAGAAPGQTIAIVLASLVATAAYATILPLIITTLGLLCIALSFHRLNMWRQNSGSPSAGSCSST